jgi:hypothetical protein
MGFDRARSARRYRLAFGIGCAVFLAVTILASCIYDKDKRCDEGQVYIENAGLAAAMCICAPGRVPDSDGVGCVKCGKNQTVQNGKCACEPGFTQAGEGDPCEKAAIGGDCTDAEGCSDPFPYCASDGDEKYCSAQDCTATSCPSGFACEGMGSSSFCKKLPKGLGASCMSNDDCADGEAKFCDTQQTHSCILTGCANGDVKCPGYYGCCDLNSLVPGLSVCTPPSGLPDGKCPFGTLVKP